MGQSKTCIKLLKKGTFNLRFSLLPLIENVMRYGENISFRFFSVQSQLSEKTSLLSYKHIDVEKKTKGIMS